MRNLMKGESAAFGERLPLRVQLRNDLDVGKAEGRTRDVRPKTREVTRHQTQGMRPRLVKPAVAMRHMTHTAVGPESYGRGGISDIYDEESHSSLMKMLRHSVGSPWHCSSICSLGKIGFVRSQ